MKIIKACGKNFNEAAKILRLGKSVAYATDTCYGLAVDAANFQAVKKLYQIKERGFRRPVHVIVGSLAQAKKIAQFNPPAERIFKKFLPGPLTLVLGLDPKIASVKSWKMLSAGTGTIGIRMPDSRAALALVKKIGRPITATSANPSAHLSGGWSPYSADEITSQFEKKKFQPDLILDSGKLPKVKPSTIVDLTASRVRIIRKGPVKIREIMRYAKK